MKGFRRATIILIVLSMSLSFTLCGCDEKKSKQSEKKDEVVEFTDSLGRKVNVPKNIERYSVSGKIAQLVCFAVDPDELVGLALEWDENDREFLDEKYLNIPCIGQIYSGNQDVNKEALVGLDPQVIVDIGEKKDNITNDLDELQKTTGIPVVHLELSIDNTNDGFTKLGRLLGAESNCDELAGYCSTIYERNAKILEEVGENKKKALYCLGDAGCNVMAKGSYHSDVLDLVCDNLAVVNNLSVKGTGNEVDFEQILKWNPEYLLIDSVNAYSKIEEDPNWQKISAVKEGNYYEVPKGLYNWMGDPPSIQRCLGMLWMDKILYPEYADYDLKAEVTEFYERFLHCKLTNEQYKKMVQNAL